MVYVGRGAKAHRLAASVWGHPEKCQQWAGISQVGRPGRLQRLSGMPFRRSGLCSPGKWPISQRRFPDSEAVRSPRKALVDSVEKFEQDVATRGLDGSKVVTALALRKFSSSPFSSELVVACRSSLGSALGAGGLTSSRTKRTRPQAIRVRWLQAVALGVGDPGAHFASLVAGGVRTVALSSLPRTPAISTPQLSARMSSASSSRRR